MVAVLALMYTPMLVMLATQDTGGAPAGTERLLQFGVLGVVVIMFITGWIVTGRQYNKVVEENQELHKLIEQRVIPLLESSSKRLEDNTEIIKRLIQTPPKDWRPIDLPLSADDPMRPPPKEGP